MRYCMQSMMDGTWHLVRVMVVQYFYNRCQRGAAIQSSPGLSRDTLRKRGICLGKLGFVLTVTKLVEA